MHFPGNFKYLCFLSQTIMFWLRYVKATVFAICLAP